jgi:hypothetical protein
VLSSLLVIPVRCLVHSYSLLQVTQSFDKNMTTLLFLNGFLTKVCTLVCLHIIDNIEP